MQRPEAATCLPGAGGESSAQEVGVGEEDWHKVGDSEDKLEPTTTGRDPVGSYCLCSQWVGCATYRNRRKSGGARESGSLTDPAAVASLHAPNVPGHRPPEKRILGNIILSRERKKASLGKVILLVMPAECFAAKGWLPQARKWAVG